MARPPDAFWVRQQLRNAFELEPEDDEQPTIQPDELPPDGTLPELPDELRGGMANPDEADGDGTCQVVRA